MLFTSWPLLLETVLPVGVFSIPLLSTRHFSNLDLDSTTFRCSFERDLFRVRSKTMVENIQNLPASTAEVDR